MLGVTVIEERGNADDKQEGGKPSNPHLLILKQWRTHWSARKASAHSKAYGVRRTRCVRRYVASARSRQVWPIKSWSELASRNWNP